MVRMARLARKFGLDHNSLPRRADTLETRVSRRAGRGCAGPLDRAIGAATIAVAALVMIASGLGWLAHYLIDRRRLAGWDAAWASIGPSWTRRGQQ
jgi:hypothetical protein